MRRATVGCCILGHHCGAVCHAAWAAAYRHGGAACYATVYCCVGSPLRSCPSCHGKLLCVGLGCATSCPCRATTCHVAAAPPIVLWLSCRWCCGRPRYRVATDDVAVVWRGLRLGCGSCSQNLKREIKKKKSNILSLSWAVLLPVVPPSCWCLSQGCSHVATCHDAAPPLPAISWQSPSP